MSGYDIGDVVTYIAFGNERRTVRVAEKEEDIKNGYPGFSGFTVDDNANVWGYDDQIVAVEAAAEGSK